MLLSLKSSFNWLGLTVSLRVGNSLSAYTALGRISLWNIIIEGMNETILIKMSEWEHISFRKERKRNKGMSSTKSKLVGRKEMTL